MDLRVNTLKSETICSNCAKQGYSLRQNAFYIWQQKRGITMEYIAKRMQLSQEEIISKLENKELFDEKSLTKLIFLMGAKEAFFIIYFPSFEFRKYVYEQIFNKKMKYEKRGRVKKNE